MHNMVYLIGRLTEDPTLKVLEEDKEMLSINLAVQRSYKNEDGIYETDYLRCILWNALASHTCEYCRKGDLVGILLLVMQYFLLISLDSFRYQTSFQIVNFCYL